MAIKSLNGIETNALELTGGTPGAGEFLQSDASGNGSWQTVTSGSTVTNYFNAIKIDIPGGTSPYGALSGAINGTNALFTVSNGSYVAGTLEILQGNAWRQPGSDWSETSPTAVTFTFSTAPTSGDVIAARYIITSSSSGSLPAAAVVKTRSKRTHMSVERAVAFEERAHHVVARSYELRPRHLGPDVRWNRPLLFSVQLSMTTQPDEHIFMADLIGQTVGRVDIKPTVSQCVKCKPKTSLGMSIPTLAEVKA